MMRAFMSGVGSILGLNGGVNGTGIAGPAGTNIVQPFNAKNATDSASQAQDAIQQQQAFLNATQAQNGLGNQSSVYNQMQGVANGTGPNPAQAQLAQATGANTANQAALMAGQRGSSSNVGLMARQAAQQGGANQQQAAGQAATLQANQSLNALGQMGGLANTQAAQQAAATGALNNAVQGQEGQVLGSIQGANNANVGMQSNINNANAGLASTTMQGQQALIGGGMNAAGSAMSGGMRAEGGEISQKYDTGGAVYQDATTPMPPSTQSIPQIVNTQSNGPKSSIGKMLATIGNNQSQQDAYSPNYGNPGANALASGVSSGLQKAFAPAKPPPGADQQAYFNGQMQQAQQQPMQLATPMNDPSQAEYAKGGKVPALVSPGEQYLPPKDVKKVVEDGKNPLKTGKRIPGKPKYPGNDYRNDIIPEKLESGGIVIPNKIMQAKNPEKKAIAFVAAHFKEQALKNK